MRITKIATRTDSVDKHGVRYFHDYNGSRVDYPTGTRFGDGYVQPEITSIADSEPADTSQDDDTTTTQPEPATGTEQWHVDESGTICAHVVSDSGEYLCSLRYDDDGLVKARMIVKALNHHAQLVAVLEQFISIYPKNTRRHPDVAIAIQNAETVLTSIRQAS